MSENKNCLGLLEKFRSQQEILKQNENIKSIEYSYPNIEFISNKPAQYFDLKKEEISKMICKTFKIIDYQIFA